MDMVHSISAFPFVKELATVESSRYRPIEMGKTTKDSSIKRSQLLVREPSGDTMGRAVASSERCWYQDVGTGTSLSGGLRGSQKSFILRL